MKHLLLFCILNLILLGASYCQYSDQVRQWPQVRLQLSSEVTAADLFKAGLRPYLRPNAESRNLYAKHAHITVVDREGRTYPSIPADILRTYVEKPWLITSMEIWTPPLTINEARAEMRKWLPITGRSEKELNDFLRAVEADWLHYDVVNGATDVVRFADGWRDRDRVKQTLWLMKSWQWQAPLRLCFSVETMELASRNTIELYDGPIPPPPGFEGADMEAPEVADEDNRFIPVTTEPRPAQGTLPPKYQAMNDKAQAEAMALNLPPTPLPPKASAKQTPVAKPTLPIRVEKPPSTTAWVIATVIVAAALRLLWLVLKRRSSPGGRPGGRS